MGTDDSTDRRQRIKHTYVEHFSHWDESYEILLEHDPKYLERFTDLAGTTWKSPSLNPKLRELIALGIYATGTTLDDRQIRIRIANALDQGATSGEILHVFELLTLVGIHSVIVGSNQVISQADSTLDPEEVERMRAAFEDARGEGHWTERWENVATFDPQLLKYYHRLSSYVIQEGPLERRATELILVGMDVAATHLYTSGIDRHARDALDNGATPAEVFEVFELAFGLGATTLQHGLPILHVELERREDG